MGKVFQFPNKDRVVTDALYNEKPIYQQKFIKYVASVLGTGQLLSLPESSITTKFLLCSCAHNTSPFQVVTTFTNLDMMNSRGESIEYYILFPKKTGDLLEYRKDNLTWILTYLLDITEYTKSNNHNQLFMGATYISPRAKDGYCAGLVIRSNNYYDVELPDVFKMAPIDPGVTF